MAHSEEEQDRRIADLYWIALYTFIGPMLYGIFFVFVSNVEPNAMGLVFILWLSIADLRRREKVSARTTPQEGWRHLARGSEVKKWQSYVTLTPRVRPAW
jgi:hypothetical protein